MTKSPSTPADRGVRAEQLVDPLRAIQRWVHDHLGIFYTEQKLTILESRLLSLCCDCSFRDLGQLAEALRTGTRPGLQCKVAHAVSTNHTGFFRELESFEFFRSHILPLHSNPMRIWSAASSTGEEAHTVAMIVTDSFGAHEAFRRCAILGSDLSPDVIRVAEAGRYTKIDGVPAEFRRRYFVPVESAWAIHPSVGRLCMFRRMNLMTRPWPFRQRFHVVFLRNILYYFAREQQRDVLCRIHQQTVAGAWLITSVTESLRDLNVPWRPVQPGIFRREDS